MKLDRHIDARGKYALINLRKLQAPLQGACIEMPDGSRFYHIPEDAVEWGNTVADEFFVLKLKDYFAEIALRAYAAAALAYSKNQYRAGDPDADDWGEYAYEVDLLADRAGPRHPLCKLPD